MQQLHDSWLKSIASNNLNLPHHHILTSSDVYQALFWHAPSFPPAWQLVPGHVDMTRAGSYSVVLRIHFTIACLPKPSADLEISQPATQQWLPSSQLFSCSALRSQASQALGTCLAWIPVCLKHALQCSMVVSSRAQTQYSTMRCRVLNEATKTGGKYYLKITSSDTVVQKGQQPKLVLQVLLPSN